MDFTIDWFNRKIIQLFYNKFNFSKLSSKMEKRIGFISITPLNVRLFNESFNNHTYFKRLKVKRFYALEKYCALLEAVLVWILSQNCCKIYPKLFSYSLYYMYQ